MRVLILHPENTYFGGAEKVLGYFLEEAVRRDHEIAVAVVKESRTAQLLPSRVRSLWVEPCPEFSLPTIWRQATVLRDFQADFPYEVVHGWTARDWELTSLLGWRAHCPAVGTLHDHPHADFITPKRQRLMRLSALWGLDKVVCVSEAVRKECAASGYPERKLDVVHNGLPDAGPSSERIVDPKARRLGFLGVFSERKGLRDLFQILERLAATCPEGWQCHLAGGAQDEAAKRLMFEMESRYASHAWWRNLKWAGWVDSPRDFLRTIDLLIVPSNAFDPFPTVLLEAGQAGVPVLAARVGGVPEIVIDQQTGWIYEPGKIDEAAGILRRLIGDRRSLRRAGEAASKRIASELPASKMVEGYFRTYGAVCSKG
jgi:glycosyltransferase involved in cell wall biosynthesis